MNAAVRKPHQERAPRQDRGPVPGLLGVVVGGMIYPIDEASQQIGGPVAVVLMLLEQMAARGFASRDFVNAVSEAARR
jgi:hypothetical protein